MMICMMIFIKHIHYHTVLYMYSYDNACRHVYCFSWHTWESDVTRVNESRHTRRLHCVTSRDVYSCDICMSSCVLIQLIHMSVSRHTCKRVTAHMTTTLCHIAICVFMWHIDVYWFSWIPWVSRVTRLNESRHTRRLHCVTSCYVYACDV